MKLELIDEIFVNEHYLNYVVYDDAENLDLKEKLMLYTFLQEYRQIYTRIYLDYDATNLSFTKCKISGLYSNCAIMKIYEIVA